MSAKGMINKKLTFIVILVATLVSTGVHAKTVKLVGNKVVTYIDEHQLPARQMDLVSAALASWQVNITATTQAWSGSGLRSGKFSGYIDHYSLNNEGDRYIYSKPYMQIDLHLVSRSQKAESITRLEQLYRERVGIENRFANTDQLRGEREVRWARSPMFFDNLKQLAERRVDYLLVDKAIVDEVNLLLKNAGLKPLFMSKAPLIKVDVSLAMNREYPDAQAFIKDFESGIESLQKSGSYSELLKLDLNRESLLDQEVYSDMLRKW
jgi:ABC-type amino acid transport substrate-binding protein